MTEDTSTVFHALGDSTRRMILERIEGESSTTATQLAERLTISRQAVTKHLKELESAGLIVSSRQGRENRYTIAADGLAPITTWLDRRAAAWEARLVRLRDTAVTLEGEQQ